MRQLTFVKPRVLEWHEVPEPRLESGRDALVSPVAATTCDLDRSLIKGRSALPAPIALGHEFCAVVTEVGDSVRSVAPGDLVSVPAQISCGACDRCRAGRTALCRSVPPNAMFGLGSATGNFGGGFSDLVRVPFADAMLVPVPAAIDASAVAAASDNLTNAYEVVPHLQRLPRANVLIAGVGGAGMYAVLMAKAAGAGRVGYLDHDEKRLELASELGAEPIRVDPQEPRRALPDLYDIGVDTRGEPDTLAVLLRSLAPAGVCISFSLYFSDVSLPLFEMVLRQLRLEGTPTNVRAHLPEVLRWVEEKRIAPERVTSEVLPWSALTEALVEPSLKPVFVRSSERRQGE